MNSNDINRYVADVLEPYEPLRFIVSTIVERACGIFLWAKLVTKNIKAAYQDGDDIVTLWQCLEDCPSELSDLYGYLLRHIDKRQRREAEFYFQLVDVYDPRRSRAHAMDVFLAWKIYKLESAISPSWEYMTVEFPAQECESLLRRVTVCTKGLIEVSRPQYTTCRSYSLGQAEDLPFEKRERRQNDHRCSNERFLDYMHRTAIEYLLENGKLNADITPRPSFEVRLANLKSRILIQTRRPICTKRHCSCFTDHEPLAIPAIARQILQNGGDRYADHIYACLDVLRTWCYSLDQETCSAWLWLRKPGYFLNSLFESMQRMPQFQKIVFAAGVTAAGLDKYIPYIISDLDGTHSIIAALHMSSKLQCDD